MKTRAITPISAKIEINKDKIYRISDPIQLAEIFFPSKNAHQRRAAFLAILFEIKISPNQRLDTTDHIAKKYALSQSALTKARTKMTRIGLIRKRKGYWTFSTTFFKTLEGLCEKIKAYQAPAQNRDQIDREHLFVEIAKGAR
jgi:hypothetical protein